MSIGVQYVTTHENLRSIVKGLEPSYSDVIIAIGGSGDNAFALLEKAGEVRVMDRNSAQIEYIKRRCDFLKKGDIDKFLRHMHGRNRAYMERRIGRIMQRLDRLAIYDPEDIFEAIKREDGFNKVYLSTAPYYSGCLSSGGEKMEAVAERLPAGGLIYLSVQNNFWATPSLAVDYRRTFSAKFFNIGNFNYNPAVYRKIA